VSEPWDQQKGEPARWFDRFERFRRMGPQRNLYQCYVAECRDRHKRVAQVTPGAWREMAVSWRWRERAEQWDAAEFERARREEQQELRKRRKEHIAQALKLQDLGVQGTRHLKPEVFTVADVIRLIESGVRQELLARGAPSEITEERRRELPAEQVDDNTLARIALEGSQDTATPSDNPQVTSHVQDASDGKSEPGNGIPAE
jgi:hypothetical protein